MGARLIRQGRVVAVLLGAGFAAAALSGRALLFVRPWFVPAVFVTGLALAVVAWRAGVRLSRTSASLLLLPLVVGLALPPGLVGRLTSFESGGGAMQSRLGDGDNPLVAGGGGDVTLLDVLLAERQVGAVLLDGREVSVEGAVSEGNRISRLVMVCCAADARPVSLPVRGTLPARGTWVRVIGHLAAAGDRVVLAAQRIQRIPAPEDPFL